MSSYRRSSSKSDLAEAALTFAFAVGLYLLIFAVQVWVVWMCYGHLAPILHWPALSFVDCGVLTLLAHGLQRSTGGKKSE